jgi:hypothetical protein
MMHESECSEKFERLDTLIEEETNVDARTRNEWKELQYTAVLQRMPCRTILECEYAEARIEETSLESTGPGWQSKSQKNGRAFNASGISVRILVQAVHQGIVLVSPRLDMKGLPQSQQWKTVSRWKERNKTESPVSNRRCVKQEPGEGCYSLCSAWHNRYFRSVRRGPWEMSCARL